MPFRTLGLCVLLLCSLIAAGDEIKQVNSWAEFRALMKANGKSDAEADARIAAMMDAMRTMDRSAGNDRIGVPAPAFKFDYWFNTKPLSVEDLRGHVVLVRWWTDTCPHCATTSPALRKLDEQYAEKGLKTIAVFHPKDGRDGAVDIERVRRAVESRRLQFPVAIDWKWQTLKSWWLTGPKRPATSVTFLLDKNGVIRYVHPGMEYHDGDGSAEHASCDNDMASIRAAIDRLIGE